MIFVHCSKLAAVFNHVLMQCFQVVMSFKIPPLIFCDMGHKCRPVDGSSLIGIKCSHCKSKITAGRTASFCEACKFFLCSRCCDQPNCSTLDLRAKHGISGCGADCEETHFRDGDCLVCGQSINIQLCSLLSQSRDHFDAGYGPHNGHSCLTTEHRGMRGSWVSGASNSDSDPESD